MKITDGRKRMMGNYRPRRRNGRGVRISWFQGLMRGPTARMKKSMSWRSTQRTGKKRGTSQRYLIHRIMCRRVTVTNYNIKRMKAKH